MANKPALLIIDFQKGFNDPVWGMRNNPQAETNISMLLKNWRKQELPVIHVKHNSTESTSPLHPDKSGNDFKDEAKPLPAEKIFGKSVNSAFIGTGLEEYLKDKDLLSLVVVGLTTEHCVSTSVRMAANLGFNVIVVSDATAAFDKKGYDGKLYSAEKIHQINLISLNNEFCCLKSTQEILEEFSSD